MFVIQLACPRDLAVVHFTLYAEDFGPGYGLVASMMLKRSVFEEFVRRLEAEVRDDPSPTRRWQQPQHHIDQHHIEKESQNEYQPK